MEPDNTKKRKTLYQTIFDTLKEKILQGEYPEDSQIPTEKTLSETYNVSRITVSRAVRELEQEGYVYRVKGSGTFVHKPATRETRGAAAQSGIRNPIISIVMPFQKETQHTMFLELFEGMEQMCGRYHYYLTLHNISRTTDEKPIISKLIRDGIHGVLVYPRFSHENRAFYENLLNTNYPFVLLDRRVYGVHAPFVGSDNYQSMYRIVEYLIKLGHRRIGYVCIMPDKLEPDAERYRGFCRAMIENHLLIRPEYIELNFAGGQHQDVSLEEYSGLFSEAADSLIERLFDLPAPPTAICALNDHTAKYILNTALKKGIRVPEDLSITGFDDLPLCKTLPVPLTSVRQKFFQLAGEGVELLIKRVRNPRGPVEERLQECDLIIRESVGPPDPRDEPDGPPKPEQ